jgi:hypothetical protein
MRASAFFGGFRDGFMRIMGSGGFIDRGYWVFCRKKGWFLAKAQFFGEKME